MKRRIELLGMALLLGYFFLILSRDPAPSPSPSAQPARDSSGRRAKAALDPSDRLPPGPIPSEEEVAYVRDALARIYAPSKQKRGSCGNIFFGAGRFLLEQAFHYRETRLIALAFPAAAEKVAVDLHRARDYGAPETPAAFPLLHTLARQGNRRAEMTLLRAAVSNALEATVTEEAL